MPKHGRSKASVIFDHCVYDNRITFIALIAVLPTVKIRNLRMKRTLVLLSLRRVGVSRPPPKFNSGQHALKSVNNQNLTRTVLFRNLLKFDNGKFDGITTKHKYDTIAELNMVMVEDVVKELREILQSLGEPLGLLGHRRDDAIEGMVGSISMSFGGVPLYPTVETRAAQLLYSVLKGHPFLDGNKRIAVALFIRFLELNEYLVDEKGDCVLGNGQLMHLVVSIARSDPQDREEVIQSVVDLLIFESLAHT